jgi:hypothetical protein
MPPIEKVSSFKPGANPAATFGKGVPLGDIAGIQKSADAVRQRSAELTNRSIGPRSSGNRDSK